MVDTEEIITKEEEALKDVTEGLALIKEKLAKKDITSYDLQEIATKAGRNVMTIRDYMNGNIANIDFAVKLLNICNSYVAINKDGADKKQKLNF